MPAPQANRVSKLARRDGHPSIVMHRKREYANGIQYTSKTTLNGLWRDEATNLDHFVNYILHDLLFLSYGRSQVRGRVVHHHRTRFMLYDSKTKAQAQKRNANGRDCKRVNWKWEVVSITNF